MQWFEVDKEGLSALMAKRGKVFPIMELLQNALDENSKRIDITFEKLKGRPEAELIVVDDNPDGFADLRHAYTLFAPTKKRLNPEQRGRFNFGEKMVLSLCKVAAIISTTGTIEFLADGSRKRTRQTTDKGSKFIGVLKINASEYEEACREVGQILPPEGVEVYFNGERIESRKPVKVINEKLSTVLERNGEMTKTVRKTDIEIHTPAMGETAKIYEMGIPVVETGDKYHINVMQKVPLNMDRDNVTPAYLKNLRVMVFNAMHETITEEDSNSSWVQDASSNDKCSDEAITTFLDKRFGAKRVIFDPSDPESNMKAASNEYAIIHGRNLNKDQWDNLKRAGAATSAGQMFPCKATFEGVADHVPADQWTTGMCDVYHYSIMLAKELMDVELEVVMLDAEGYQATYQRQGDKNGKLVFYVKELGKSWFNSANEMKIDDLLLHEFGHQFSNNHLSQQYYDALTRLGAKLKWLAARNPTKFRI